MGLPFSPKLVGVLQVRECEAHIQHDKEQVLYIKSHDANVGMLDTQPSQILSRLHTIRLSEASERKLRNEDIMRWLLVTQASLIHAKDRGNTVQRGMGESEDWGNRIGQEFK